MFSLPELIFLGLLAIILIGPKQLPEVARVLGKFFVEMKRSINSITNDFRLNVNDFTKPNHQTPDQKNPSPPAPPEELSFGHKELPPDPFDLTQEQQNLQQQGHINGNKPE